MPTTTAVCAQDYVGQFLATFRDFQPRQKAATFNMDEVLAERSQVGRLFTYKLRPDDFLRRPAEPSVQPIEEYVRFWPLADIAITRTNVRLWAKSGHSGDTDLLALVTFHAATNSYRIPWALAQLWKPARPFRMQMDELRGTR
jgi:hypothetical protein